MLFHIKISKTITACIGIGGATRCDGVSIALLSAWKILLMDGVRGGLTDPNWALSFKSDPLTKCSCHVTIPSPTL